MTDLEREQQQARARIAAARKAGEAPDELDLLIAEQADDDTDVQKPERDPAGRPVLPLAAQDLDYSPEYKKVL